ncbi:hypothetical protein L228DRAFT_250374 [Xylona heveae TC161]|uniref:Uncharacterized protein n=1 Tax=Xylona heveae (strain CBS 132557 / TC161) TaxID=1328760 RepID=A0A165A511_XYLHT|nr:hypothetical protein L228DRAFT_250374 [Xylona heveae TC161]KZF19959.1 hypothetical protein L228DRAFT_250374 [Xylona heveae TC161]
MSSDEEYSAFLEKANQDTNLTKADISNPATKGGAPDVPQALLELDEYYVSDSDEPFEPFSFHWDGPHFPSIEEFKSLIDSQAEITTLDAGEFDPRGYYKKVLSVISDLGDGDLKIYRVQHDNIRAEYFIMSRIPSLSKVIGAKARAVET